MGAGFGWQERAGKSESASLSPPLPGKGIHDTENSIQRSCFRDQCVWLLRGDRNTGVEDVKGSVSGHCVDGFKFAALHFCCIVKGTLPHAPKSDFPTLGREQIDVGGGVFMGLNF